MNKVLKSTSIILKFSSRAMRGIGVSRTLAPVAVALMASALLAETPKLNIRTKSGLPQEEQRNRVEAARPLHRNLCVGVKSPRAGRKGDESTWSEVVIEIDALRNRMSFSKLAVADSDPREARGNLSLRNA